MASADKTTEKKLRELDQAITRQEAALATPSPRSKPLRVTQEPVSRRARLARRVLAWSIGLWCAFCFVVFATGEAALADPIGLFGMAFFLAATGYLLDQCYLWQWRVNKGVADWFRRRRNPDRPPD